MNNKKSKLGLVVVIAVLLLGGGVLAWWFLVGNKSGETISCSKNGNMLSQAVAITYQGETPTKISYDYKFDKDKMPDDDNMNFSFSYSSNDGYSSNSDPEEGEALSQSMTFTYDNNKLSKYELTYIIDHTVDEDDLTSSERNDLMTASFMTLGLAELEGSKGVNYRVSESSTITTISFVADIPEMGKDEAAELTEDLDGKSFDDIKTEYSGAGFTCEKN